MSRSLLEILLEAQLYENKIIAVPEYRFDPDRKWRFDFAIPALKIGIECEGGIWLRRGRHTTPVGFTGDLEKYNAAALAGWTVLRFTRRMIEDGTALRVIQEAILR